MNNDLITTTFAAYMKTSKTVNERIKKDISSYNLSTTEFYILEVLFNHKKLTIQQICNKIYVMSGSMTYVIDKLETKGYLKRISCPNDRRVIHVSLTNEGEIFWEEIAQKYETIMKEMFGNLKEYELHTLKGLLESIEENARN